MLPLLAVGDLTAIYNELRSIHLRTLNKVGGGWLLCCGMGGLSCAWGAPGTHSHWLPQVRHVPATPRVSAGAGGDHCAALAAGGAGAHTTPGAGCNVLGLLGWTAGKQCHGRWHGWRGVVPCGGLQPRRC